jgi:hypothetical protein
MMKILSARNSSEVKVAYSEAIQRIGRRERFTSVLDRCVDDDVLHGRKCPYCEGAPQLVDSVMLYGTSYGMMWLCQTCDAYVGIHKDSDNIPLGRLANRELRYWKKEAHASFDPIWKTGKMKRKQAYTWLCSQLQIERRLTHIGMFNVTQCRSVVAVCTEYLYRSHK